MTRRRKFLFAVIVWIVLLLLGEGGVRLAFWALDVLPPVADSSLENEWKWATHHLALGKATLESELVHDEITGWKNRPGVRTEQVTINSAGMRGPAEFTRGPAAGRKRVVFVGDSYTFGVGVADEETFCHVLARDHLPDWDVINLAVPGTGTDQQVLTLEHTGRLYHPDVVVLGYYVRDYSRNILSFRDYAKPRFVLEGAGLRLTHVPVPKPEELFADYVSGRRRTGYFDGSLLYHVFQSTIRQLREASLSAHSEGWQVSERLVERFQRVVRESGAMPVLLIIPYRDVQEAEASKFEDLERMLEQKCTQLDLVNLNLSGPFRQSLDSNPDRSLYRDRALGGHLSAEGHALTAFLLSELLGQ